ncbi:phytoene desaturase family protein [Oligoflexus tunisiensis]|uniref:phytoene desaturase family protein n=1 Tax=Oligoflexus tunisiensis TaxID=708132 RepID=UPI000AC82D74|nr:NAD(P)/FAD-dependent oxidoreductase [Oligoflexus tunisiensis]
MTIGTLLRRASLENHYDTIVIGSGIGGLTTAVCLAKAGQKVLVLERHYTAGGFTHTYERKGYEWDVGVHYIGDVHREGSTLRRVFDYISDQRIQWAEMEEVYDRIYIGSESFDYVKGEDAFRERMIQRFPEERNAIIEYLKLVKQANRSSSSYFMEHALPSWLAKILHKKLTANFLHYASQTTEEVLLGLTKNRKLIAVLTGQWGDYGLPPSQSSFVIHAMVAKHYLNGAAYPVGGSAVIAQELDAVLRNHGAQLITSAEVESIVTQGNKATGVKLVDGRIIHAKNVVSGAGVINTFQKLLPDTCSVKGEYLKNLQYVSPSFAHMCLYIGLKVNPRELGIPTTNLWIYPNEHHDANLAQFMPEPGLEFPVVYISFPSSKDPAWETKHPGKGTIEMVVPAPYQWFEKWKDTKWQKRGSEYKQLKQDITDRLLSILLEKFPQLKDKIHYTELSSPLSTAHFSNYQKGEIYGINHDPQRFKERWLRTDTPVRNLYLTGQDIVTCGVGGALSAGVLTAIRVLGPFRARHLINLMKPYKPKAQSVASA